MSPTVILHTLLRRDDDPPELSWSIKGNSTCLSPSSPEALWPYCPSYPGAIVFAMFFSVALLLNLVMAVYHRKSFCWTLIMGAAWSATGFILRVISTRYQQSLPYYTSQQILIILAPLWINAFLYMLFARMVLYFVEGGKVWVFSASKISLLFVLSDVVTFLVQLTGASMLSSTDVSTTSLGKNVYMAGVAVQQLCLLLFLTLVIRFHRVVRARSISHAQSYRTLLILVYVSIALITVRTIYRLVEFSGGIDSPVARTESPFFLFDALMIWAVCMIFGVYHPGIVLKGEGSEFTKQWKKAKKDRKQEEQMQSKMKKKGAGIYAETDVELNRQILSDEEVGLVSTRREDAV